MKVQAHFSGFFEKEITTVTTNKHPLRVFSSVQTCRLVDVNQPLLWFLRVGQEKILSSFLEHPEEDSGALSHLSNILLQDLTPLYVKITKSMNWLSVCRRKLKLSTYLHTVSYNDISFLNTRQQLVWVFATCSSGFCSITWRVISRSVGYKIHFWKQPPFRGNFFAWSVWYLSFLWISTPCNSSTYPVFSYNLINKQPENLYANYREFSAISPSSQGPCCFNNVMIILPLNEIIKNAIETVDWRPRKLRFHRRRVLVVAAVTFLTARDSSKKYFWENAPNWEK